ncbi:MAG: discoidin domain-containing protein [Ferruginibacter sp.]
MNLKQYSHFIKNIVVVIILFFFLSFTGYNDYKIPDHAKLATEYFGEDAQWYLDNIPFFECSDKQMAQVYYYRWKMYKAHIRNTGTNEYVITEFINHVPWDRDPYCTINAASMHHIYEGRWLKDNRYMDGYINNLFQEGGNNRRYSESVSDAAYARYLVNGDAAFLKAQLDSMISIYKQWDDHWEEAKQLYYIPAMPDATEYTIASIDASGGKDGFAGGEAFRPTINSYMYANALAISKIAAMKGDAATSDVYLKKAKALKANVQQLLWNDSMQHFCDRFKVDNEYVHYWNFIRGRELAGMAPWYFSLPDDDPKYNAAWKHLTGGNELLGKYGLRTNEPSYEYYFRQFVFNFGKPGSQWNGPSWPYQTSQAITSMANLLNNYNQEIITNTDYVNLLRLYTKQHYLPDGKINMVENYDPNTGGPIVYYYWSNHYNHSTYNNLVISGLCGIRPSASDTLDIKPLIDNSISYFYLGNLSYHGHQLTVMYDREGNRYNSGKGLTVLVDGIKTAVIKSGNKYRVFTGSPVVRPVAGSVANYALNIYQKGYPLPSASVNAVPDSLYQAVDGRIWYFPEITNRWSTIGSKNDTDWFAVDFGTSREISTLTIYPYVDGNTFALPVNLLVEYYENGKWSPVKLTGTVNLTANTANTILFDKVTASQIRITGTHGAKNMAFCEIELH